MNNVPLHLATLLADMVTIAWNDHDSISECNDRIRNAIGKELDSRGSGWQVGSLPVRDHGFGPEFLVLWRVQTQSNHGATTELAPWDSERHRSHCKAWATLPMWGLKRDERAE